MQPWRPTQQTGALQTRVSHLDGLRGLAILLVIGFHAYARWGNTLPYGTTFANVPLFSIGSRGVQLFFLISGFVIFWTLDKTSASGSGEAPASEEEKRRQKAALARALSQANPGWVWKRWLISWWGRVWHPRQ